ncbi:hypothetical protein BJ508DRAFT_415303 [Ascobolus immersus RN42]|uniref:Rieske domain-containing protein n=1 Tax=Ascobolus immersus RN42 TaxID=1160509 RepID=A0A3N4IG48_ASCIM|nr:hypothetical protein BJ508DRAFT_415303 [Ascobolus immersus RN42]
MGITSPLQVSISLPNPASTIHLSDLICSLPHPLLFRCRSEPRTASMQAHQSLFLRLSRRSYRSFLNTPPTSRPEYIPNQVTAAYYAQRHRFTTTTPRLYAKETTNMSQEFKLKTEKPVTELKNGDKIEVEVEGVEDGKILLAKVNDEYRALGPRCTHYGAPLVKGVITGDGRITCPWHGACFNTKTGDIENAPALDPITSFPVLIKNGQAYISGTVDKIKAGSRTPDVRCKPNTAAPKILIVGGGSGAVGAIESLRGSGYKGEITVVSKEPYYPIDRTKLSKALLTDLNKLQWRDADFYKEAGVNFITDDEVTDVDFKSKKAKTKKHGDISYDNIILATGGTPRRLPLPGFDLKNVFVLRDVNNAKEINAALDGYKGKKVGVVGSSFIGLEIANCLQGKGAQVTVIGQETMPFEKIMGPQVGGVFKRIAEKAGVKFYMDAQIEKATPSASDSSKAGAIVLKDGTSIPVDAIVLAVGVGPATDYVKDDSLKRDDKSFEVDNNFAIKGLKNAYAIGDIATYPYYGPGAGEKGSLVRIEHWNVAQNSGRQLGRYLATGNAPTAFTPIFWSALGVQLRYCGSTYNGFDDIIIQGNMDENKFVAYYTKGDEVVAVATMQKDPIMTQAAELMRRDMIPTKTQIKEGIDLLQIPVPAHVREVEA